MNPDNGKNDSKKSIDKKSEWKPIESQIYEIEETVKGIIIKKGKEDKEI